MTARLRLHGVLQLPEYPVDAAWAPDGHALDGHALVVGLADGALVLVDVERAAPGKGSSEDCALGAMRRLPAHSGAVLAVAWQRAGNLFASSGEDGAVLLWDARTLTARQIHRAPQWSERLAFSPDGRWLGVGTARTLTLFDAQGEPHYRHESRGVIAALAWRPRSGEIAAAGNGGVQLHRVGRETLIRDYPLRGACVSAAFNPDGRLLAAGLQEGAVQVWNLATGSASQMAGYGSRVYVTEWSASGRYLATAGGTTLAIWDFSGKGPEGSRPLTLEEHSERITAAAFRPGGAWLASTARDRRLLWWRIGGGGRGGGSGGGGGGGGGGGSGGGGREGASSGGAGQMRPADAQLLADECSVLRFSHEGTRLAAADASGRLAIFACEP